MGDRSARSMPEGQSTIFLQAMGREEQEAGWQSARRTDLGSDAGRSIAPTGRPGRAAHLRITGVVRREPEVENGCGYMKSPITTSRCEHCGHLQQVGANFCSQCGRPIGSAWLETSSNRKEDEPAREAILLARARCTATKRPFAIRF